MFSSIAPLFAWNAPDGPDLPFGDGVVLFDLLRLLVITMCAMVGYSSIQGWSDAVTLDDRARRLGMGGAFVLFIAPTEIQHIGDYANWRLFAAFIVCCAATWGIWAGRKYGFSERS